MQLVENNKCMYVISDIGRRYELCVLTDFAGGSYDILMIMDFDYQINGETGDCKRVVDFLYGATRFNKEDSGSLCYIKRAIQNYEKGVFFNCNYNVLKEF